MKKEYCVNNISMQDIIQIEKRLYRLYRDAILKFEKRFSPYKCNIEIIECWTTGDSNNATNIRPTFEHKYVYWICYEVLYNEKPFVYDNENSPLTRSYAVLAISKAIKSHESKGFVKVFDDTEDVMEELVEDLNKIKQVFSQKAESNESL